MIELENCPFCNCKVNFYEEYDGEEDVMYICIDHPKNHCHVIPQHSAPRRRCSNDGLESARWAVAHGWNMRWKREYCGDCGSQLVCSDKECG